MAFEQRRPLSLILSLLAILVLPFASAENVLRSSSLEACQQNSEFTASLFDVVFTPNNNTVAINMAATSTVSGMVVFDISIRAYGYQFIRTTIDPCEVNLPGLCPMGPGLHNQPPFNLPIPASAVRQIPGIAYTFPDLDATVQVYFNMTSGDKQGQTVACVRANISNGMTVDLIGVKWATAIISGLALIASAIVSGLGYTNASSHVASMALSLFGYFQAQAMIGLCGVPLPPIVRAWTQDFQWSMGIIKVDFIQDILTWYQRSTGGTASNIFDSLATVSVQVEKRALQLIVPTRELIHRSIAALPAPAVKIASGLARRANIKTYSGSYIVYGIQRVAFLAGIETTNLFLTGLTFFYIFVMFTVLGTVLLKGFCELAARRGFLKGEAFEDFRRGWLTTLKGLMFRLLVIGFPQMTILCFWEFTQNDSPAAMVLAVFFFFGMAASLAWASFKIISIARRSISMHRNPAYILFSNPQTLNKWGFLYVQYRASAYYFVAPILFYILIKGMFIGLAQASGTVQAVAFIVLDAAALITASVMRPWMDKSTNSFNIAICSINFVNAIFLFIFTDVLSVPPLVIGVVGVVLWIANAAFSLILLLMLIITTGIVLFHNNPDTRYQFMNDDRASFMKSQNNLHTSNQLEALAATARNSGRGFKPALDLDDDVSPVSSASNMPRPSSLHSARNSLRHSVADYPMYQHAHGNGSGHLRNQASGHFREPSPLAGSGTHASGHQSQHSLHNVAVGYRNSNPGGPAGGSSQWQRGAGYD